MTVDWNDLIRRLRAFLLKNAYSLKAELDDLEGDILAELAQKIEAGSVEDPNRLVYSIARFRITDRLRSRQKRAQRETDGAEMEFGSEGSDAGELLYSDSQRASLIAFHLREYFVHRLKKEECARLVQKVLDRFDWRTISEDAESKGASEATLKKRWSRCLQLFKESFGGDLDDLILGSYSRGAV